MHDKGMLIDKDMFLSWIFLSSLFGPLQLNVGGSEKKHQN